MGAKRRTLKRMSHLRSESGIALIVVLGIVSLFSVLVTMQITTSKVVAVISKVGVDRNKTKYAAESATAYAQWLIMNYNFNNPTQSTPEDEEEEIWVADGQEHELEMVDGITAKVSIYDVARGWDINQLKTQRSNIMNQQALENEELREQLDEFFAVFDDYTDPDDLHRHPEFGMEKDDYESLGLENFPRNGNLQFREEMYWLKNVHYLVPRLKELNLNTALPDTLFQVVPPPGIQTRGNTRQSRTPFWSAPMHWLEANVTGGFTESERDLILKCRQEGFIDELTIQECLGFELFSKLRGIRGLTFNPRGTVVFTIDVTAFAPNGEIARRLVTTMDLRNLPSLAGSSDVGGVTPLTYWQKIFY